MFYTTLHKWAVSCAKRSFVSSQWKLICFTKQDWMICLWIKLMRFLSSNHSWSVSHPLTAHYRGKWSDYCNFWVNRSFNTKRLTVTLFPDNCRHICWTALFLWQWQRSPGWDVNAVQTLTERSIQVLSHSLSFSQPNAFIFQTQTKLKNLTVDSLSTVNIVGLWICVFCS